jgi:hypothetical protein
MSSSIAYKAKVLGGSYGEEGVIVRTETERIGIERESVKSVWHHRRDPRGNASKAEAERSADEKLEIHVKSKSRDRSRFDRLRNLGNRRQIGGSLGAAAIEDQILQLTWTILRCVLKKSIQLVSQLVLLLPAVWWKFPAGGKKLEHARWVGARVTRDS